MLASPAFVVPAAQGETVKLAVTDLVGLEELQREFGTLRDKLSDAEA